MKNTLKLLICLVITGMVVSCSSDDDTNETPTVYDIEGKWLWSPDAEDRSLANTMYEFVDGIRYTSYADCWPELCTDADFNALDSSDRIPGTESYTFDGGTLTIDETANAITFECDGGTMHFPNGHIITDFPI